MEENGHQPIIQLCSVTRAYQMGDTELKALDKVSLQVNAGDYLCIMGPSGCGKSTMLNLLGCLDQPNEGTYILGTENVSSLDDDTLSAERGKRLGFIFQSYNLIPQLTVLENIEVPLFYQGISPRRSRERALELAERVGLGDRIGHRPTELSGGQQQRVAIARALANDPLVILADEATGNLDSKSGEEILKIFAKLNEEGKTLIFVTHDEEMAKRGNRVLRLRDGRVEKDEVVDREGFRKTSPGFTEQHSTARRGRLHLSRSIYLGLKSLWLHRLRSLLTALGIVFGVASVIAMLAIGEGASFEAQEQIRSLGSQNVIVRSVKPPGQDDNSGSNRSFVIEYGVTARDVRQMLATIPGIKMIVPNREVSDYIRHKIHQVDGRISGVIPTYPQMRNRRIIKGRFFNLIEMEAKRNVCVLSREAAAGLFPLDPVLGNSVRVGDAYYYVIGVIDSPSALPGNDESSQPKYEMFVPLETMLERYGDVIFKSRTGSFEAEKVEFHEVTIVVDDPARVESKAAAVRHLLESNHEKPDFEVIVPVELLRQAERTKQIFSIVLGSIAAISLVVGGIGIMNIMLASVTERTREIGIRRALGGRRQDITTQFLIEATLLSGVGGVIGVALGLLIPVVVTHFSGMMTVVKTWAPVLAFTISVVTGVVFGIYPALRAAGLSPVEALRHE
ncbi:MAG: ATP-binding cassette domain-containing protein [Verrucomicrobiales bacterium]|nr:ATP-binding cassette domain-containing protein [Verrucomicrobiales bacterium]